MCKVDRTLAVALQIDTWNESIIRCKNQDYPLILGVSILGAFRIIF